MYKIFSNPVHNFFKQPDISFFRRKNGWKFGGFSGIFCTFGEGTLHFGIKNIKISFYILFCSQFAVPLD